MIPSAPIENVWNEKFEELAKRWEREGRLPDEPEFDAQELVSRANSRLRVVQNYNRVPSRTALLSRRQFEQAWNPAAVEKSLRAAAQLLGWNVYLAPGGAPTPQELSRAGLQGSTILLDNATAGHRAASLRAAGLPRPWTNGHALMQMLAEDVYDLTADRMGNEPAYALVEETARHLFVQESLGLPFNPWALRFALAASGKETA